jgi:hypothetical protein
MRIEFKRAGGYAGPSMTQSYSISLEDLPSGEAEELRKLVEGLDVASLASRLAAQHARPDTLYYRVVIEDSSGLHTIETSDTDMPASLRPLVTWLTKHAPLIGG